MTTALVIGGARHVYADIEAALTLFKPDCIIGVKEISVEYPQVDIWATYHIERVPRDLRNRRALGYPDPREIWTQKESAVPRGIDIPVHKVKIRGGSSGLLGTIVGLHYHRRVVLAGIPMNPDLPHYHKRKNGKPWSEAKLYQPHWLARKDELQDRVRSMSGWTRETFGYPTVEWLNNDVPFRDILQG